MPRKGNPVRYGQDGLVTVFLTRWLMATALVLATYNPTPYSLLSFLGGQLGTEAIFDLWAPKLICLLVFGVCWWIFLKTSLHSLGGMAVAVGIILMLLAYVVLSQLAQYGVEAGYAALVWIALLILGFLLGVGVSASHVKRRWSGISNVEEVDND